MQKSTFTEQHIVYALHQAELQGKLHIDLLHSKK
jgi:hypothetical protein